MNKQSIAICAAIVVFMTSCSGYEIKNGKAYYKKCNEAIGCEIHHLPGSDAATFKVLKHSAYALDKNHVYYEGDSLVSADPSSFISINGWYGRDSRHAYYQSAIIRDADGSSFSVIEDGPYSRDKKDVYFDTVALHVDIKTFKILDHPNYQYWAKDSRHYYINEGKYPLADYNSFQVLKGGYAKDKLYVYYMDKKMAGANPATFKVTNSGEASDIYRKYNGDKPSGK